MKTFVCVCGSRVYFENTCCLNCQRQLGYIPDLQCISALEPMGEGIWRNAVVTNESPLLYRACIHYSEQDACNWMVAESDEDPWCSACRLNDIIPDLSIPDNRVYWFRVERAKRRLIYTLNRLGLPVTSKKTDAKNGLSFAFLADDNHAGEFYSGLRNGQQPITTGHADGLITINIAEADDVARAEMRTKMGEKYRTLLGHFRHEIGHYYWDRLVRDSRWIQPFRDTFGDERRDYSEALKQHYDQGPPSNWSDNFISQYASAHPWEDWGESFAHYLHMYDTLETASHFGFVKRDLAAEEITGRYNFDGLMREWVEFTTALNLLNRSMGLGDAYPFVLPEPAYDKLQLVSDVIFSSH